MSKDKKYFQAYCDLSQALGTAASAEELLALIVRCAKETLNGKAACLFLKDNKTDLYVPKAKLGLSDTYIHADPVRAKKIAATLEQEGHLIFADIARDTRLENRKNKLAEGIGSLMTVGVKANGLMIGILTIYMSDKHQFTDTEIEFLKALATIGGMALKKARLIERTEKNAHLLLELSAVINSSLDIKDVLHNITQKISKAMGMRGAAIRLLNQSNDTLNLVASYGLSGEFMSKGKVLAERDLLESLDGKTVIAEDLSKSKYLQYPKETEAEGLRSMITVPIQLKDETIGVLRLYGSCVRKFPDEFIKLLQALAHTGALAIRNASMYLALKEDKKHLEDDTWSHQLYF